MQDKHTQKKGLIVAAHGRRGSLEDSPGHHIPYLIRGRQLNVVCGDVVNWHFTEDQSIAVITEIQARKNSLERQPPNGAKKEILAANLTMLAAVCATEPDPDWFLIDRFLCSAELMGCQPLVVLNKKELMPTESEYRNTLVDYENIGYQVLYVSAKENSGIEELHQTLSGQIAILVGQSGVGKSSLINRLAPEAEITTQAISSATHEGRHTTTASAMHDLPNGGRLIDTPGVRDFIPAIPESATIQNGFREFLEHAAKCKYSNCLHLREPSCGVKLAVDSGTISNRRYESYKRLFNIVREQYTY